MLALFFTDYKCLRFHSRKSICRESVFDFLCVILKLMTPPLCNSATRRADQQFCTTSAARRGRLLLTLCACFCMFTEVLECAVWPQFTVISTRVVWPCSYLSFINMSMRLNPLAAVSPYVMQQRFAVIAAFSYAAVFDLMKNVNRQAGYVTQCRVSRRRGGLVIGLKTEQHWECDLTQTYATFV